MLIRGCMWASAQLNGIIRAARHRRYVLISVSNEFGSLLIFSLYVSLLFNCFVICAYAARSNCNIRCSGTSKDAVWHLLSLKLGCFPFTCVPPTRRLMLNLMLVTATSLFSATKNTDRTSNHSVGLWHNAGRIISTYTTWCRQPGNAAQQQTSRARAGLTGPPPDVQDAGSDTRGWRHPSTTQRPVVYAGYVTEWSKAPVSPKIQSSNHMRPRKKGLKQPLTRPWMWLLNAN